MVLLETFLLWGALPASLSANLVFIVWLSLR